MKGSKVVPTKNRWARHFWRIFLAGLGMAEDSSRKRLPEKKDVPKPSDQTPFFGGIGQVGRAVSQLANSIFDSSPPK
jgi:hypothetical protein